MKQPIAGVAPVELGEVTIMTVWPSVAIYAVARALGRAYELQAGAYVFRLGNLIALATAPLGAMMYLQRVGPFKAIRYRLTNRRIIVERGLSAVESHAVDLDRFDSIEIDVRPGQGWYHAGDLVFKNGNEETFRLEGVSRPEAFRHVCLKARNAHAGVKSALNRQAALA